MDRSEEAQRAKAIIMKDLITNKVKQKCVLDMYFEQPKVFKTLHIRPASKIFLERCESSLRQVHQSGAIIFFRECEYEKILNEFLGSMYKTELKMENFLSEQEMKEQDIINNIGRLKWKKIKSVKYTAYETCYNGEKIRFCENRPNSKSKKIESTYDFTCDGEPIKESYEPWKIIGVIEKTQPKVIDKTIIYMNPDMKFKTKKNHEEDRQEMNRNKRRKRKEKLARKKEWERILREQEEEERLRLEREKQEAERLKKEKERQRQKELESLPQIGIHDFIVKKSVFKCTYNEHKLVDIVAAVTIIDDEDEKKLIKISAGYCENCRTYFIMKSTYEMLRKRGIVLCRIIDEKEYRKYCDVYFDSLADESILMQYGYNVSQQEGLSETRRQKILAVIIDNKIMTKSEIISYLDFFISQRESRSQYQIAIAKWEKDRDFVQEYRIGEYTQYGVNAIYRR